MNAYQERTKPCADCGASSMGEATPKPTSSVTAAGTYDLLISWGVAEDAASAAVELGVRATSAHDAKSVLAAALSASSERARVAEEEYVRLETAFEELEEQYNVLQEAFEGHYSPVKAESPFNEGEE